MLVLFIRIDGERIWENWGIGNDLGSIMQSYALLVTTKKGILLSFPKKRTPTQLTFYPFQVIEFFFTVSR